MERISDETFLEMQPDMDNVYAITVKDGEFYFCAWMEDAENYKIQAASSTDDCKLSRDLLIVNGDLYTAITECDGYHNAVYMAEGDISDEEAYKEFLSYVGCYTRDGVSDENDHDILIMTKDDICNCLDLLRDGDYIIVLDD